MNQIKILDQVIVGNIITQSLLLIIGSHVRIFSWTSYRNWCCLYEEHWWSRMDTWNKRNWL